MTPQQFAGAYLHTAQLVTAGTGIDAFVLLAQWANETDWGNVVVGNNLGNIRCTSTSFCHYATLDEFAAACVATFHNGYYAAVLAAVGPQAQLAAIVASPWDAGHYGGSLQSFYSEVFKMDQATFDALVAGNPKLMLLWNVLSGTEPTDLTDMAVWWATNKAKLDALLAAPAPAGAAPTKFSGTLSGTLS